MHFAFEVLVSLQLTNSAAPIVTFRLFAFAIRVSTIINDYSLEFWHYINYDIYVILNRRAIFITLMSIKKVVMYLDIYEKSACFFKLITIPVQQTGNNI